MNLVARLVVAEVLADGHRSEDRTDFISSVASQLCFWRTTELQGALKLSATTDGTWLRVVGITK